MQLQGACNEADARAGDVLRAARVMVMWQPHNAANIHNCPACHNKLFLAASLAAKLLSATTASSLHHTSQHFDASTATIHLLRSFLDSSVSMGAFNKTSAAAASVIISSLTYACDNSQRPNVQQLLLVPPHDLSSCVVAHSCWRAYLLSCSSFSQHQARRPRGGFLLWRFAYSAHSPMAAKSLWLVAAAEFWP